MDTDATAELAHQVPDIFLEETIALMLVPGSLAAVECLHPGSAVAIFLNDLCNIILAASDVSTVRKVRDGWQEVFGAVHAQREPL